MLTQFAELARRRGDAPFAERCDDEAAQLRENIEQHGWDGEWYRRAYFDDGTPLGSASNAECQIDSIAAKLGGALRRRRSASARAWRWTRVDQRLVRRDARADPAARSAVRQVRRSTPATSRATCPACARTAASTPTPRSGRRWPSRRWATRERAWELFAHDQSRAPRRHAGRRSPPTRSSRTSSPPTSMRVAPHTGRGGWTWYTGSAGWMYRLIVESLLGLHAGGRPAALRAVPAGRLDRRSRCTTATGETVYHITVRQTSRRRMPAMTVSVDGVAQAEPIHPAGRRSRGARGRGAPAKRAGGASGLVRLTPHACTDDAPAHDGPSHPRPFRIQRAAEAPGLLLAGRQAACDVCRTERRNVRFRHRCRSGSRSRAADARSQELGLARVWQPGRLLAPARARRPARAAC